jgi:hypothetical protein
VDPQNRFGKQKSQQNSDGIDVSVTSHAGNILSHMVMTMRPKNTLLPQFGQTRAGFRTDHRLVA